MGMSCGGLQAIEISLDPRISTTVVCNSGVLPDPSPLPGMPALKKDVLQKLHAPVLYIMGGPSDIAYNNAMDDFSRVEPRSDRDDEFRCRPRRHVWPTARR